MRRKVVFALLLSVIAPSVEAQTNFTFNCTKDTFISGCNSGNCVNITLNAKIPDIHASSSSYVVNPASTTNGCFPGSINPGGNGTPSNLNQDDRYSSVIALGFPFSFFGTSYTQLVLSTNGYLSFDVSLAGDYSHWEIMNGSSPQNLPSNFYDPALIMGPYHDLFPGLPTSPTQKIQYNIVGTSPHRKFVLSYYKVPMFSCSTLIENTHQIILYESTGIVDVFIYDKQICSGWNQGRAMIGMQNFSQNQGIMVNGRRASDPPWGNPGMNETWRFVPAGGASLFRRVELYTLGGTLIATGTTSNSGNGILDATFNNVCVPSGINSYLVKSVYTKIDDPNIEVFGLDTIRVTSTASNPAATATTTPTNCDNSSGSIVVTASGGNAPYQYSLNGGPFQSGNVFSGLSQNTYTITVRDNSACTFSLQATVDLQNNLTINAGSDTTICRGASFTRAVSTNASSVIWSPSTGLSNPSILNPVISPQSSTNYLITATQGICTVQDNFSVTVIPGALVNAGPDATIIEGDVYTIQATASPGNYTWTPSTGLSAVNVLNPTAMPLTTTMYTLTVTTAQGCVTSDDLTVTVIPYCVKPMEAFTPNGDGMNDRWLITNGNCLANARVQVFNRYGASVFESKDYKNTWDGSYNGKPLADGTYYYVITYKLINGKSVFIKGNVTILR